MTESNGRSRYIKLFSLLLISLLVGGVLFYFFGESVITDLYNGRIPFTSIEFSSQTLERPLDYYLERADIIVWDFLVVGLPLTVLFWTLVYFVFRKLLRVSSRQFDWSIPEKEFKYDVLVGFLLYCGITVLYCLPILEKLSTQMIGPPEDNMFFYWNFWWMCEKVMTGSGNLVFTDYMFYPEGTFLYYHSWSFYSLWLSVLLNQFFNQVVTYNIIALHGYPLAGVTAFLLVKYLTRNSYLALLGGFMFAFCPYHFGRTLHHMNLNPIHFVPLLVLFHIKSVRSRGYSNAILAGLFLLLNTLCSWVYMIVCIYFMALSYIYIALKKRGLIVKDVLIKTCLTVGLAIVALSPWLVKMIPIGVQGMKVKGIGRTLFVTDVFSIFVPGEYHWAGNFGPIADINSLFTGNKWEIATYLGLFSLVIIAIVIVRKMAPIHKYLAGVLAFIMLSLGPELHVLGNVLYLALPDSVLAYVPLFSSLRTPVRNILFAYIFWSIAVPIASAALIGSVKKHWLKVLLIVAIPLLIFVDFFRFFDETADLTVPTCYEMIPDEDVGAPLLDLPYGYVAMQYYKYYQTFHNHPMVQGHTSRKLSETLIDTLDFEDIERQREQLTNAEVRYVIIHKDIKGEKSKEGGEVDPAMYNEVYDTVYEDSCTILYRVY